MVQQRKNQYKVNIQNKQTHDSEAYFDSEASKLD